MGKFVPRGTIRGRVNMQLSKDFHYDEMACRCPDSECAGKQMEVDEALIEKLQRMRDLLGRPLVVTSGLRCPEHNAKIGGHRDSEHLHGRAADLAIHHSAERFQLAQFAFGLGFRGIGIGQGFIHVDTRREGHPVAWTY